MENQWLWIDIMIPISSKVVIVPKSDRKLNKILNILSSEMWFVAYECT